MEQQLISAAAEGNTEAVLASLEGGADINATNSDGDTAVMVATHNNQIDTVRTLIENGADLNIRNNKQDNVLLYVGAEGLLDILKLALQAGADTTITNRYWGTALIPASDRGHVDIVEELLTNSDTNVNHLNNLHWTALLEAIILGDGSARYQEIVQLLVDHGADIHISDKDGVTPLEHAKNRGFKEIEYILTKTVEKSN